MPSDYTYTFSFSSSSPFDATITGIDSVSGTEQTAVIPSKTSNSSQGLDVDVVAIGDSVFDGKSLLRTLTFENPTTSNFTSIGNVAFEGCSSLVTIEFPESLTSIGYRAFGICTSLETIEFPDSLTSIGTQAFFRCNSLETIEFPDSLTSIGDRVFNNCSSLETIEFPESLTSIGYRAFGFSSNLTSITFPESLTSIGTQAFVSCSSLKTIEFPESLTSIVDNAFYGCSSLETITWYNPNNLTSIGTNIFEDSNSINTVTYYNATSTDENVQTLNNMTSNGNYSLATIIYAGPYPIPRCFKDGTYILCKTIQNDQERLEQLKVQDLKVGTLVKTKYDGFKPIVKIISSVIKNNPNYKHGTNPYNKDQLYTCSVNRFDDLFEDLVITGSHSILVFPITDKQKEDICGLLGELYVTDHKYRLPACLDERCVVYPEEGDFTIYHFALEKECKLSNYGVFANGLLVETASIFDLEGR